MELKAFRVMKIDRMIGILSFLLQEEKTTAPELAEVLEPAEARNIIRRNAEETLQIYKEN